MSLGLCPGSQEVLGGNVGTDFYTLWLHYESDHFWGALGETNYPASSSMDVTEQLLCAYHHVRRGKAQTWVSPQEAYDAVLGITRPHPRSIV